MISTIINSAILVFLIVSLFNTIKEIKLYKKVLANQAILIKHNEDMEILINENTAAQRERTQATRQLLARIKEAVHE